MKITRQIIKIHWLILIVDRYFRNWVDRVYWHSLYSGRNSLEARQNASLGWGGGMREVAKVSCYRPMTCLEFGNRRKYTRKSLV
jgi:hypothetical protein